MSGRKKLIEVALPLEAINRESAREKSIRHGHPSTLHLWWARRPLAACRAVLFAQLVDDPSAHPERFPTEEDQERERQRLFAIIEELVKWESSTDERVLEKARAEIRRSCDGSPPPILDPFCGGGSIPLEAQRLGLEAHASDLNPVAVLITKALIEIPPKFAGQPPVHPDDGERIRGTQAWKGAQGLAEDVRWYGEWMRREAEKRIGHLYPRATFPDGSEATVIAWLWARTVTCPNPACGATMPLVRSFWLGKKKGKEAWVQPVVEGKRVRFEIRHDPSGPPDGTVTRRGATCLVCGSPVPLAHVRAEGKAGRMGAQLMAIVAEGDRRRVYLPPTEEHEQAAAVPRPEGVPETELPEQALGFRVQGYGMTHHADLFTNRQLTALTTFSDLVGEARERVARDAVETGLGDAASYADAVATYLACAIDRVADRGSSLCSWDSSPTREAVRNTFARQAMPMNWDFAEGNAFAGSSGNLADSVEWVVRAIEALPAGVPGTALQRDAARLDGDAGICVISTDPPYYDNVGYSDLSDFFYVWLRRSLDGAAPDGFQTLLTPKSAELVADPFRFDGDRATAERFFEGGFRTVFQRLGRGTPADFPMTVFYAFKQSELDGHDGVASTGWETMLDGMIGAGLAVTATWPMRTELGNRMRNLDSNALATSIVLACRPRPADAPLATRKELVDALKSELPEALHHLQQGNIAPVDLAQAAIGPGMAVFSRYAKVLEPDGEPMRVRTALGLINQVLAEVLEEQEGEFDPDTRWAVTWFEQYGTGAGPYGVAETLSKAKVTSVEGLVEAGILEARAGKVRLLAVDELDPDWDPATDRRPTVWEATHHLIRHLETGGEGAAAHLLRRIGGLGDAARDLAYRLYSVCERRKWAQEALGYNALVVAWPEIARLAAEAPWEMQETLL